MGKKFRDSFYHTVVQTLRQNCSKQQSAGIAVALKGYYFLHLLSL